MNTDKPEVKKITFRTTKNRKEAIKRYAEQSSLSLNGAINVLLREGIEMERRRNREL